MARVPITSDSRQRQQPVWFLYRCWQEQQLHAGSASSISLWKGLIGKFMIHHLAICSYFGSIIDQRLVLFNPVLSSAFMQTGRQGIAKTKESCVQEQMAFLPFYRGVFYCICRVCTRACQLRSPRCAYTDGVQCLCVEWCHSFFPEKKYYQDHNDLARKSYSRWYCGGSPTGVGFRFFIWNFCCFNTGVSSGEINRPSFQVVTRILLYVCLEVTGRHRCNAAAQRIRAFWKKCESIGKRKPGMPGSIVESVISNVAVSAN